MKKLIKGSKVRIPKGTVISRIIGGHVVSASLLLDPSNVYRVNHNTYGQVSVRIPEWSKNITFKVYQLEAV